MPRLGILAAMLALTGYACAASECHAQSPPPVEGGEKFIAIERDKELRPEDKTRLQALTQGKPLTKNDESVLERAAQWYIYRLTWPQFQERRPPDGMTPSLARSTHDLLDRELFPLIPLPEAGHQPLSENQQKYDQAFIRALIPPIQRVLKNTVPIARINAALVLER